MENPVERIIGIDVVGLDHRPRAFVQLDQTAALERRHAIGGEADAHGFHLCSGLEHVHDPFGCQTDLNQPADDELSQRLPHRGTRGSEAISKLLLFESRTGDERAGRDLACERIADAIGEEAAIFFGFCNFEQTCHSASHNCAHGEVEDGRASALVAAQEGHFMGSAFGEVHGAKLTGLLRSARALKQDVVILFDTCGGRLQEANAGELAIAEIMRAVIEARRSDINVIGLIGGRAGCCGGGSPHLSIFGPCPHCMRRASLRPTTRKQCALRPA